MLLSFHNLLIYRPLLNSSRINFPSSKAKVATLRPIFPTLYPHTIHLNFRARLLPLEFETKSTLLNNSCSVGVYSTMSNGWGNRLILRNLQCDDYHKGYMGLLQQLTIVGNVTEEQFTERFKEIQARSSDYHIIVYEDAYSKKIIATGTLLIERKFLRTCGLIGHIEDVVVDSNFRGHKLGQRIIAELDGLAKTSGCYKVILDCNEDRVPFYEKCGFSSMGKQMCKYY